MSGSPLTAAEAEHLVTSCWCVRTDAPCRECSRLMREHDLERNMAPVTRCPTCGVLPCVCPRRSEADPPRTGAQS